MKIQKVEPDLQTNSNQVQTKLSSLISYNGHKAGCVCNKCGEARDMAKLLVLVFKARRVK